MGFFYHTQSRYVSTVLDIDPGFSFDYERKQSFRLEEIRRFLRFRPAIIISTWSSPLSSSPAFTASFGVGHHSDPSILTRQGPIGGSVKEDRTLMRGSELLARFHGSPAITATAEAQ